MISHYLFASSANGFRALYRSVYSLSNFKVAFIAASILLLVLVQRLIVVNLQLSSSVGTRLFIQLYNSPLSLMRVDKCAYTFF